MLEAKNLMVFYENMLALNNISITCPENSIVGIFGANSAGKSTLMYALSGIILDIRKKEEMLGVAPGTLERHGAVSEQTAREMASGALARSRADIAMAITGVAGPTGGTPDKPVGMVCFAWARVARYPPMRRFSMTELSLKSRRRSGQRTIPALARLLGSIWLIF